MDVSSAPKPQSPPATFLDRLGGRFVVRDRTGGNVEILVFANELASAPGFEAALRESVTRLTDFRHPCVRRVRGLARLAEPDNRLALVSDLSPGSRLSELLYAAEQDHREVETKAALFVIRGLLVAVTAMQQAARGVTHGAIGPERILITPDGRVLLAEYTLGAALECHASLNPERLWKDYRLPVHDGNPPRFGPRTELIQIGLVALSLLLGRLLRRDEFPRRISELLLAVGETGDSGSPAPLGLGLRAWLLRMLQISAQDSYGLVEEARAQFEYLLGPEGSYSVKQADVLTLLGIADPLPVVEAPPKPAEPAREQAPRPQAGIVGAAAAAEKPRLDKAAAAGPRAEAVDARHGAPAASPEQVRTAASPASPPAPPDPAHRAPAPAAARAAAEAPAARVVPPTTSGREPEATRARPKPTDAPAEEVASAEMLAPTVILATAEMAEQLPQLVAPRRAAFDSAGTASARGEVPGESPAAPVRPLSAEDLELPPGVACVAQDVRSEFAPDPDHALAATAHAAPSRTHAAPATVGAAVAARRRDGMLFATPEVSVARWRLLLRDRRLVIGAVILALLMLAVPLGWRSIWSSLASRSVTGTLRVDSRPGGAEVYIDGRARGRTPLAIRLAAGFHRLEVGNRSNPQVIPLTIARGAEVQQFVEFPAVPERGELRVVSEPPGARVFVDGTPRGSAPVTVTGLSPGEHAVALEGDAGTVKQTVTIESGTVASLVVPLAGASAQQGWIAVTAAVPLQIVQGGRVLGTSQGAAVAVPAGRHAIELVNTMVGYRETRSVDVAAGKMTPIAVEMPSAILSLNATPWAEVWVDGKKAGDTPLGNLSLPVGPHEVVFRHPEFGEQRQTVVVKLPGPTRVSVDLRK
jgi:PEGA domain